MDIENLSFCTELTELEMETVAGGVFCEYPGGYAFYFNDVYVSGVNLSETACYGSGGLPFYSV